ncbi:MAG: FtsX-like permease family protein [Polyangia bacterium]|jgi:lipoprotein-releasing system permease protein
MGSGFYWLVALRYLRMRSLRSAKVYLVPAIIGVLLLATALTNHWLAHTHVVRLEEFHDAHQGALELAKIGMIVAFVLVGVFVLLVRRLTIFTTISTYGLFLGTGALVIALSVMSGFERDLRNKILGANADVVITRPHGPFTDYDKLRAEAIKLPEVTGATPYVSSEAIISSSSNLAGVVLKGIDPATVGKVTKLSGQIDTGSLDYLVHPEKLRDISPPVFDDDLDLDAPKPPKSAKPQKTSKSESKLVELVPAGKKEGAASQKEAVAPEPRRVVPGVIVGRELAKSLRVFVGDDVKIVSPNGGIGPTGPMPKSRPFRVAGIFFSGMYEYDSKYVYLAIPAAQKFLGEPGVVTGLELKVRDPDRTGPVVDKLKSLLGSTGGYEVEDWQELNRNLFSALKLEKIAMFIVLCFIILVAAFSIIANGIMLVMEKGREIAILKSMGASDRAILVVFMLLGLYMGGLGTLAGIGTGIVACLSLARWGLSLDPDVYYITQLPVRMSPSEIAAVAGAAILIAILATLYPAWVAARLKPVEGLREGNH